MVKNQALDFEHRAVVTKGKISDLSNLVTSDYKKSDFQVHPEVYWPLSYLATREV